MTFDDIKDKRLDELDLTAGELYELFKKQYDDELNGVLVKQWN